MYTSYSMSSVIRSLPVMYHALSSSLHGPFTRSQVIINERCVRALVLVNSGMLNYDFVWDVGTNPRIAIKPEAGTVPKGERMVCELAYHPHVPDVMRDYKVSCQIINGMIIKDTHLNLESQCPKMFFISQTHVHQD